MTSARLMMLVCVGVALSVGLADAATLRRLQAGPYTGSPTEAAQAFVAEHGAALGAVPAHSTLAPLRADTWRGRTAVRLQQLHRGVPVEGGVVIVQVGSDGIVDLYNGAIRDGLDVEVRPAVDSARAQEIAIAGLAVQPTHPATAKLVVLPARRSGALAWQVVVPTGTPISHWRVTVDAVDGGILDVVEMKRGALGNVYETSPANGDPIEVTLTDLDGQGLVMDGAYAISRSIVFDEQDDPQEEHLAVADPDGNFLYEPDPTSYDDPFAEVHTYYQVTNFSKYYEEAYEHSFPSAIQVTVNFCDEPDTEYFNAYFTMDGYGGNYLVFGQGDYPPVYPYVDFGYDADVIAHEHGHALTYDVAELTWDWRVWDEYGWNNLIGGVSEGMADYWSGTLTGDAEIGEYVHLGRSLEAEYTCPEHLNGESHNDGEIVGPAMWDVNEVVGLEAGSDIVYGALLLITPEPTFQMLAEMVVQRATELADDGDITADDVAAIEQALTDRGMFLCGRSLMLERDEDFEYVMPWTRTELAYSEEQCLSRRERGRFNPGQFQFEIHAPAEEGPVEELELNLEMTRRDFGDLTELDLLYHVMIRESEMATLYYEEVENDWGHMSEYPYPDEYDLLVEDQTEGFLEIVEDGSNLELKSDTSYFVALLDLNCVAADLTLSYHLALGDPPADDDDDAADDDAVGDDDDDDGCSCSADRRVGAAPVLLLALVLMGALRRR